MEQIKQVMQQMIKVSEEALNDFLGQAITKTFKRQEIVSQPYAIPNEIFFINKGLIRVLITDNEGIEHTIHLGHPSGSESIGFDPTIFVFLPQILKKWQKNWSASTGR